MTTTRLHGRAARTRTTAPGEQDEPAREAEQPGDGEEVYSALGEVGQPDPNSDGSPDEADREGDARPPANVGVSERAVRRGRQCGNNHQPEELPGRGSIESDNDHQSCANGDSGRDDYSPTTGGTDRGITPAVRCVNALVWRGP